MTDDASNAHMALIVRQLADAAQALAAHNHICTACLVECFIAFANHALADGSLGHVDPANANDNEGMIVQ